ncbi:MAG: hypothetical protein KAH01_05985, partial [Caldisericia bacterium]|nr:hypothetical protein [Caldisericia bacterium]
MTGNGNVGSQLYTYDQKHWLASFTDTGKQTTPTFNYTYSSAKELTYLDYPNNLQLNQVYTAKNITSQTYTDTATQTTFSSIGQSFSNDKLAGYSYNTKAGINTFSDTVTPSYVSTGAMKEKLDTLTYSGSGRVITYGYDANQGRLNSLKYSDIDPNNPFTLSYDAAGRMSSITDPNSQSVASYNYNVNDQGKLSSISYGNGNTAGFTWNAKNKITNYVYTDNTRQPASTKAYEVSYYDDGRPSGYSYTLDMAYQYEWKFYYSPAGLDKAEKWYYATQLIDIDTTVAPNGKVLSMTYADYNCQTGSCYSGEAYCLYDPCGNLTSVIDNATSTEVWARAIDKNTNGTIGIYNPYNMEIPISAEATINPAYDQAINGPIDIYIGETGHWSNNVQIGNTAKLTTYIGDNGAWAAMKGDDDCNNEICGNKTGWTCDKKGTPDKESWDPFCNCVRNCFASGDTENQTTNFDEDSWNKWESWIDLKESYAVYLTTMKFLVAKDNLDNWMGIISSLAGGATGGFGAAVNNLLNGAKNSLDMKLLKAILELKLLFAFSHRQWLPDTRPGETGLQRFERYCNLEDDCRKLCESLIPEHAKKK